METFKLYILQVFFLVGVWILNGVGVSSKFQVLKSFRIRVMTILQTLLIYQEKIPNIDRMIIFSI